MATCLRFEYRLVGASNFSPWKERIIPLLEKHELWYIVEKTAIVPMDATLLVAFNKRNVKSERNIIDAIKYHVIPHVRGKKYAFEMWEYLTKLY